MPAPTNIDPATATDLGALPISFNQDPQGAGTGPNGRHELWFKYTHNTSDVAIGLSFLAPSTSNYAPRVTAFDGLANANLGSFYLNFQFITNLSLQVPVVNGNTYYFVVVNANSTDPLDGTLTITGIAPPTSAGVVGSFLVNEDIAGFPLVVVDSTTGLVLQIRDADSRTDFPGGEAGVMLPSGISMFEDTIAAAGTLQIFGPGPNMLHIATVNIGIPNTGQVVLSTNRNNTFYVLYPGTVGNAKLSRVSDAGVVSGTTFVLGVQNVINGAPNLGETIFYYQELGNGKAISRWDLVNNIALSDLAAGIATYFGKRDLLTLSDGTVLVAYAKVGDAFIKHYSAAGAVLNTYALGVVGSTSTFRMMHSSTDDTSFWVWTVVTAGSPGHFLNIRVSDGVILADIPVNQFEQGVYAGAISDVLTQALGTSNSCSFIPYPPNNPFGPNVGPPSIVAPGGGVTPTTATIIVAKVTSPADSTNFDFESGTLSPDTFSLANGQSRSFTVLPGTYDVDEVINALFATTVVVSNGNPKTAIVVAAGDTVTVTFTNTAADLSGIYKIVRDSYKTNDTLWIDETMGTSQDVKIPDPQASTALIGD